MKLKFEVCLAKLNKLKICEQELERVEDVWRGEAQDLLSQIAQLQEENKNLLSNMSLKDSVNEEDLQRHEGKAVNSWTFAADLQVLRSCVLPSSSHMSSLL
ncbi:RILP-like protein 1 [Ilyodon furcidens]|uniref:RILP-like protein 1 n=1 Tax=Ilyodon furcidens TaxID=33524 RepID=A0ABV0U9X3_9TELE